MENQKHKRAVTLFDVVLFGGAILIAVVFSAINFLIASKSGLNTAGQLDLVWKLCFAEFLVVCAIGFAFWPKHWKK